MAAREKIMLGGESKSGKTFSWLSIARSNPDSQFYVAEPDDGINKVLENEYEDVLKHGNVHGAHKSLEGLWMPPEFISQNWKDVRNFVSGLKSLRDAGELSPDDWIILEGMDIITRIIRSEYIADTNKIDSKTKAMMADPWEAIKSKRARGAPVLEPSDHDAINYEYEGQMTTLVYTMPCNFLGTSGIERIHFDSKFMDEDQKQYYASLGTGLKLEGHKRNPRMFDTIVYLYVGSEYQMEVLGDRGIGKQSRRKCTDFWLELQRSRAAKISEGAVAK